MEDAEEAIQGEQAVFDSVLWTHWTSVQFSSAAQSHPTLCDSTDCSTPGLPVHHQLPELTQTHVHVHCGEGNGNPLQYSCLENPLVRGALWAAVHRVAQSWTPLKQPSMHWIGNGNPLQYSCLENPRDRGAWWAAIYGVARHDWSDLAAAAACSLSWWCHPTISSSVVPFSSHSQSYPASGSFQMNLHIEWPKYWSFSFSISPSNKYLGLISFRMNWLDLLAVQGTLKSLLQHHISL